MSPAPRPAGDPRTARTQARLRAALLSECAHRPLAQVSLSEVARQAGVGRATLYLHYMDLQALALDACADVVWEAVEALHAWAGPPDPRTPPPPLVRFLEAVMEQRDLYSGLLLEGGGGPLGQLLHSELRARSQAERERAGAGDSAMVASAVAAVFTGVLADWLHGRITATPDALGGQIWRVLLGIHRFGG